MWRGRRAPANRADRARLERAVKAKAITRDVLVVGIGALAVMSLRDRSVVSSPRDGIDLFLSTGPVLVSLSAAVVVLRVYPVPMRAVQGIARRTRRIGGLLTLARAREKVGALPLITLALALAVAAFGALLSTTVVVGQENASWQRTGGEVRIRQELTPEQVATLTDKGLTVSTVLQAPATTIALGSNLDPATVLAVDSSYADVVEAAGLPGGAELRTLATRAEAWSPGDPLPAIASPSVAAMDVYGRSDIFLGRNYLPIAIEPGVMSAADGWAEGPYVIVPLELLLSLETQEPIVANRTFVSGVGADDAVTALGLPNEVVTSRQAWLDASRGSALIGGVQQVMVLAVGAVAALAALGLLVSVIDGSRQRSRALALLRTQGVGTKYGWLLAAADLVPLILGAAIAGAAGAALVVWLLTDTLGLDVLTGEITAPVLAVNAAHLAFGGVGLAVLALGAMLAEVVAQRRSKLSEVLRYGETR
jgi:putative ABC transport system permease protein